MKLKKITVRSQKSEVRSQKSDYKPHLMLLPTSDFGLLTSDFLNKQKTSAIKPAGWQFTENKPLTR